MKEIALTQNKIALVDDNDYDLVIAFSKRWYAYKPTGYIWYAGCRRYGGHYPIHWLLFPKRGNLEVDHINRNGLDNRRENLRLVTRSQNMLNRSLFKNNSSGITGVHLKKDRIYEYWCAYITVNKKRMWLGRFKTKEEAITARKEAQDAYTNS